MNAPEKFYTYTLSNGLRIILQPTEGQVSYAGFAINAGTRDERADQPGMAHFVEHMLFKGTEKRKAWHILNHMEKVGADLDAYTNKEETVVLDHQLLEGFEEDLDKFFEDLMKEE